MTLKFERVAGPYQGYAGGVAWDGGDAGLTSLYLTAGDGCLYRAQATGRRGFHKASKQPEK